MGLKVWLMRDSDVFEARQINNLHTVKKFNGIPTNVLMLQINLPGCRLTNMTPLLVGIFSSLRGCILSFLVVYAGIDLWFSFSNDLSDTCFLNHLI